MWWRRKQRESDLERELQAHLDLETEERGGDSFAARRSTGNRTLIQENTRAMWGWTQFDQIARDLGQGTRMMRRRPVFTAVAILSLAIGIGANTAIFSFANAILIRTLPVAGADRLVILRQHNEAFHMENCCIRMNVFPQLRAQDLGFEDILGVSFEDVLVKDGGQSERLDAEFITPNLYTMLGVRAAAGRVLNDADDAANATTVVVISHRLWIERFGAQADTIGRQIEIDGTPFQIVGVSQPGYSGLSLNSPRDLQIPVSLMARLSHGNGLEVVGRLRPGVSEEQALERLNAMGKRVEREAGLRINDKDNFRFADGSQGLESSQEAFGRPVLVLTLLVGVVLLVACANLTALLLVRSVERSQEASMRVALGASRLALFRQFFAESLMLAGLGGACGWGVALLLVAILSGYLSAQNPTLSTQVQPDATVFIFAALVTLGTAVLFGTWPAWRAARADPLPAMHGASGGSRRRTPVSRWIISAQVALSLALLFCAGLFTRTLGNLRSIDLGFEPENLIVLQPSLQGTVHEGAGSLPFFQEFLRQAEQLPVVRNASLAQISLLSGSRLSYSLTIPGYVPTGDVRPTALWHTVSRGYFRTMGIPLLRGEDLPLEMIPGAALPVLVNEQFARQYLSGEAVGKTFSMGKRQAQVIGLVGTTKYVHLVEEPQPIIYLPFEGGPSSSPGLLQVRTNGSPEQAIEQLRALLKAIDPSVPINSVTTMEMQIDEILGRERLLAFLSTLLGGVAVALSGIGLYGVLAFSVARRTREIGIRMAIGARRSGVVAIFLKEGGWLVGGGVVLGIPLALVCGRAAETLLYGLEPQDTATMFGATGLLLLIAVAAALIPSWRAARIDPIRALRHE